MKKKMNRINKSSQIKKGFTIIELVVVIALISVLALVIIPNVSAYRENADETKVKSEMLNVFLGAEAIAEGFNTKATTEQALKSNDYKDLKSYTGLKNFTGYSFVANADGSLKEIVFTSGNGTTYVFDGDVDDFMK